MNIFNKILYNILEMTEQNDRLEIKNNDVLNQYIKELNDDVKLSEYNLREKSMTCSSLWAKWLSYLFVEKENLQRISDTKQKILKKKMAQVKAQDSVLRMKSEEKLSENDENMKKLNLLREQTQSNIDFIERALGIFANFGFQIKNTTDVLKLQISH